MLGGSHHVRADREIAEQLLAVAPEIGPTALANRHFMRRALRFLLDSGIRQFLDLGSGIPTAGNVHEIAQRADPESRVVYVDFDPVAVAHSRAILADNPSAMVLEADLRQPETVLTNDRVHEMIDFSQPLGVLLVAVLHFIPDSERPAEIIARYRDALSPGSYLVISQASWPKEVTDEGREVLATYERTTSPVGLRSRDEVALFFTGFEVVEPGLVPFAEWRPEPGGEPPPKLMPGVVGVGLKR